MYALIPLLDLLCFQEGVADCSQVVVSALASRGDSHIQLRVLPQALFKLRGAALRFWSRSTALHDIQACKGKGIVVLFCHAFRSRALAGSHPRP